VNQRERALNRIDKILDNRVDIANAYAMRARLGRAVLESAAAAQDLAEGSGQRVEEALVRLRGTAAQVMQPSEPFDGRWQVQWQDVLEQLQSLRQLLVREHPERPS
jgi:hypothetical protein